MEYEVRYTNDRRILASFYKATVCRTYRMIGIVILIVGILQMAGIICGLTGIVRLNMAAKTTVIITAMGIAELAIGILLCSYHRIMAGIAMKQGQKMHGGPMPETRIVMGEQIVMTEGRTETVYDYSSVTTVRETDRMYCLMMGKYAGIVLPKDGFVTGDREEFASWIKEKCVRLHAGR